VELVAAALVKLGHLVALDAFYQPLRLKLVAPPLSEHLPFLARARALTADMAEQAVGLAAAFGLACETGGIEFQEALWERLLGWKRELAEVLPRLRERLLSLLAQLGQEELLWARSLRRFAQVGELLKMIVPEQASAEGLRRLLAAAPEICGEEGPDLPVILNSFSRLQRFLEQEAEEIAALHNYLSHPALSLPERSLLSRPRARVLGAFARGEEMVEESDALRQSGRRWAQAYRKQYLAWHAQAHSPSRFAEYCLLRNQPGYQAAERLARLPLSGESEFAALRASLEAEIGKRCPGEDLPAALGASPVCPRCQLGLGQAVILRPVAEFREECEAALGLLRRPLLSGETNALLRRRLASEQEVGIAQAVGKLLDLAPEAGPEESLAHLSEPVLDWLKRQLAGRLAGRRSLGSLEERMRGKELSRAEIEERFRRWLDPEGQLGPEDFLEIGE